MMKTFELESLGEIDGGRVKVALEQAINRAVADLRSRPGATDKREVALVCTLTPVASEESVDQVDAELQFVIKEKLPVRKSKPISMATTKDNGLLFNDMSQDNVRQGTLDQVEEATGPTGVVDGEGGARDVG